MSEYEPDTPLPVDKADLIAKIEAGRVRLWAFIDGLAGAQFTAQRDPAGWTIQDHLMHLAIWERGITTLLQGQPRYPSMGLDEDEVFARDDVDWMNQQIFEQNRHLATDAVLAALRHEQARLSAQLARLSDADLQRPYTHYQSRLPDAYGDEPILYRVVGNTYEHYDEHLPWMQALL